MKPMLILHPMTNQLQFDILDQLQLELRRCGINAQLLRVDFKHKTRPCRLRRAIFFVPGWRGKLERAEARGFKTPIEKSLSRLPFFKCLTTLTSREATSVVTNGQ
jgi:hypothetical protein